MEDKDLPLANPPPIVPIKDRLANYVLNMSDETWFNYCKKQYAKYYHLYISAKESHDGVAHLTKCNLQTQLPSVSDCFKWLKTYRRYELREENAFILRFTPSEDRFAGCVELARTLRMVSGTEWAMWKLYKFPMTMPDPNKHTTYRGWLEDLFEHISKMKGRYMAQIQKEIEEATSFFLDSPPYGQ